MSELPENKLEDLRQEVAALKRMLQSGGDASRNGIWQTFVKIHSILELIAGERTVATKNTVAIRFFQRGITGLHGKGLPHLIWGVIVEVNGRSHRFNFHSTESDGKFETAIKALEKIGVIKHE